MGEIVVGPLSELPPGQVKVVFSGVEAIGVYNCDGELFAIEDRCTHDDGPLCEGDWDADECAVYCPRHGAKFDLRTGKALTLPAFQPAKVFPVSVEDGVVKISVD